MRFTVSNRDDENSLYIKNKIIDLLLQQGWEYSKNNPEIIICVGGDGTILRAIHEYIGNLDTACFVGLHTGTLGFLTDYVQEELDTFIHDLINNKSKIEERPLLEVSFPEKNETIYSFNEVRIESITRTLLLDIFIDGEFFEQTRGSGICISTQAGSSAINRALSGAVVDSGIDVLQLCEIMPITNKKHHSLRNPYIMREDRKIIVKGQGDGLKSAHAAYDYMDRKLTDISEIHIQTSIKKVRFARYRTYSYLKRLKNIY